MIYLIKILHESQHYFTFVISFHRHHLLEQKGKISIGLLNS